MTSKELVRVLKKVSDNTEILIDNKEILSIERKFTASEQKMQLNIVPKEV
uniref:Uncharacterized protein n=1 Tax=viral metagenome TaxID=1070528 RepID=A0A6M3KQP7_9ZZZZ